VSGADDRKVALITGAAGGLGRSLAVAFQKSGYDLFLSDKEGSALRGMENTPELASFPVHTFSADMGKRAEVVAMVDRAAETYGHIDVLVNNAAVCTTRSFWELTEEDWDVALAVNVKGVFFALQAAAPHMPRGSSVINIASVAGRVGRPALLHYAASKAAVISITRSAAAALAEHGIRVNAVAPGMIDTAMLHSLQQSWNGATGDVSPQLEHPTKGASLLQRVAQPAEIAESVLFLAGKGSSYMTGQTMNVCGGIVMS
jgi:NAD(P)-dependent dehydrogenase (short-subunit alcohol dehydrogenase family)